MCGNYNNCFSEHKRAMHLRTEGKKNMWKDYSTERVRNKARNYVMINYVGRE